MPGTARTTRHITPKPITITDHIALALEQVKSASGELHAIDLRRTRGELRENLRVGRATMAEIEERLVLALQADATQARAS